jgi:hypothetical protein
MFGMLLEDSISLAKDDSMMLSKKTKQKIASNASVLIDFIFIIWKM